ncbi:MAG: bifunctional hydroxymethylpyrimidine kinase/phosphomethylpyrimidine kinase [Methanobacteriota archaeon]|nr:MAG: bifunctional hydroxymethylpyrimidine kinase/phosphomethylpyrimidine kinase [Euryarchaeota archaeon]
MTNILTVAGSDPAGGAGIQADLKAIEAVGLHACTVITCVTAQNTQGVQSIHPVPPEEIDRQLKSILSDIAISAAKTGMLYDAETVKVVSRRLRQLRAPLVVDPVMKATAGGSLSSEGLAFELKRKLVPLASVVTPNAFEAKALTGVKVTDLRSARRAARHLMDEGAKAVLIKGGHLRGGDAVDYLFQEGRTDKMSTPRVKAEVHGTGCILSALIAANMSTGIGLEDAVRASKAAVYRAILSRERVGKGVDCVNPMHAIRAKASKASVLEELADATPLLETLLDPRLLPEVGSNMAYAAIGAAEPDEVAAFEGRITRVGDKAKTTGCARFGASKHVARIVLAASSEDPLIRCALNIKYSSENMKACRDSGLSVASFDRSKEPKGVSSMTWGVTHAIRRHKSTPDVIADRGGMGKEPMIRMLGETPSDVIAKLRRVLAKLD